MNVVTEMCAVRIVSIIQKVSVYLKKRVTAVVKKNFISVAR
jgi:hypothetical protein